MLKIDNEYIRECGEIPQKLICCCDQCGELLYEGELMIIISAHIFAMKSFIKLKKLFYKIRRIVMEINLERCFRSLEEIEAGDIILFKDGLKVLIVKDSDGSDYRGLILPELRVTDYYETIRSLIDDEFYGNLITKVVKSENLILGVK